MNLPMTEYRLTTEWRIEAPLPQVCTAILLCAHWPEWWEGVKKVEEIAAGDDNGVGSRWRFTWKGRLPYQLVFDVQIIRYAVLDTLEGLASGEVEGTGRWHFYRESELTVVRHEWEIRTTCWWMNLLAPVARPVFKWNHDQLMRQGGEGLARLLGTRLR